MASFSSQIAAVDLAADRHNDQLECGFTDRLSEQARGEYDEARQRYGYRVFKDRKFVVCGAGEPLSQLRQLCTERGTRSIVYRLE